MKLIYVASPYSGDTQRNIEKAKEYCIYTLNENRLFFCPHLIYPEFLNDNNRKEREYALKLCKEMILKCDELWVFGEEISKGMQEEIEFARDNGTPIHRIIFGEGYKCEGIVC